MNRLIQTAAAFALLSTGFPSTLPAQNKAAPGAAVGKCASLAAQWKLVEYKLAENEAEGITDNSAPRATMRAIQDSNELTRATMILDLTRAANCPLPSAPPSGTTYMVSAMECRTETLKDVKDSPKCKRDTWTRLGS